jgi:hypothetical protein
MSTRERVMTQEQLMKVKIKYLEDRMTTMEKSLGRLHEIVAIANKEEQGFKDIEQGESDTFRDADTMEKDHELI